MKKNLSIIIPVYNGEKYLKSCLDSILYDKNNDFFEVILINDGSKDNSLDICNEYREKFDNIVVINNANYGVSYTRNCGIKKAKGKYIMFVDCDDYLKSDWKEICQKIIEKSNEDIILISKYFDENDTETSISKSDVISYIVTHNSKKIRISGPYSKLFRKNFIFENKIKFAKDIINGEDMLFCLESILKTNSYKLINDSFYVVRHNRLSSTRHFDEKIINSEEKLNNEILKLFNEYKYIDINYIEFSSFINSIRTLSYRLSFLKNYFKAKKIYKSISNEKFYSKMIRKYKTQNIYCRLWNYKLYFVIFTLCKLKNFKNIKDYMEEL